MKLISTLLLISMSGGIVGCNEAQQDDHEVQREEEYNRDDTIEKRNMETPNQLELDRGVMDLDSFKLDP